MQKTNSKIRVLIIPSWAPTNKNKNAGVFIFEQARLIALTGAQVDIFRIDSEGYSFTTTKQKIVKEESENELLEYTLITKTKPKIGSFLINEWASHFEVLYQQMLQDHGPPDIIHAQGYIAGFAARRLAEKHCIPFVLTEHNTSIIRHSYKFWHKEEIRKTYSQADQCISVGKSLTKQMKRIADVPIETIPNLVNEGLFFPIEKPAPDSFEFICVGGLEKRKRVESVIHVFAEISLQLKTRHSILRIVGDGAEYHTLKRKAEKLGIKENVFFHKSLPLNLVADKMQKADALITVSKSETFGKVIIEALACGIPVIASESADPENIVYAGNGIKITDNLVGLPEAMIQITQETHKFNPQKLHREVIKSYGKEVIVKQIISVYERILISKKGPAGKIIE